MKNPYVELAKMFKDNENPHIHGVVVGKLIGTDPVSASINESIIANKSNSILSYTVSELVKTDKLKSGDAVIIMVSTNNKQFFILDKAV